MIAKFLGISCKSRIFPKNKHSHSLTFKWMPNLNPIFNFKRTLISRDGTHSVSDGAATGRKSVQNDASLSNCQPPKFNSFNLTRSKNQFPVFTKISFITIFFWKHSQGLVKFHYCSKEIELGVNVQIQTFCHWCLLKFNHL